MVNDIRTFVISWILIGLFAFSLIMFAAGSAFNNNSNITVLDNTYLNESYHSLNDKLGNAQQTATGQKESFEQSPPQSNFGWLVFTTIISVGKNIGDFTLGIYYTVFGAAANFLGIDITVISTLTFITLITIIFLLYRMYRQG